jgi:peptidoglycan/xylan/chitin deacetylase (PgdA/CDA1 family)
MLKAALRMAAPAGSGARLSVLIFHRVLPAPDPLRPGEPTAAAFEARVRWLNAHFNVLPLAEAAARLAEGTLPERPLAITFDDGYADNCTLAMPILRRWCLPATFFVASGYLDGGRMFNDTIIEAVRQARGARLDLEALGLGIHSIVGLADRRAAIARILEGLKYLPPARREWLAEEIARRCGATLPEDLMMTAAQVASLHVAGMEIGGHTVTHPILAETDPDTARREIANGRAQLEAIVDAPVRLFAYPNGRPQRDYAPEHVRMVRELGFTAAVSTAWGAARRGADPFQLPRFTPWDRGAWRFGWRMARNLVDGDHAAA